ncbi:P-loop containing nucleoside triphosphate hydrolase protein [Circinella umbellata]|nr:P-loop containing nucleoside triphosphate hydrolase protein [Circinella umbellata]
MVLCYCNRQAVHYPTKKPSPNQGRYFYTCEMKTCQFFIWDDETPRASQESLLTNYSFSGIVGNKSTSGNNPLVKCGCKKPARHLFTKKLNKNHGRWFYNCPLNSCGFFLWDDETPRRPISPASYVEGQQSDTITDSANTKLSVQFYVHSSSQIAMIWYGNNGKNNEGQHVVDLMKTFATFENNLWVIPTTKKAYKNAIKVLTSAADIQEASPLSLPSFVIGTSFDIHPLPSNVAHVLDNSDDKNKNDDKVKKQAKKDDSNNEEEEEFKECLETVQDLDLWKELKPFQREGVKKGIRNRGRILLGDEMGLGKTLESIAISYAYLDEWPVLVICPSSIRRMWENELLRWTDLQEDEIGVITQGVEMTYLPKRSNGKKSSTTLNYEDNVKLKNNTIKFWITSYDLATKYIDNIIDADFKIIIADESHFIKNQSAKRTRVLIPVLQKAKRAILLTGTPVLSRPLEVFSQVSALCPDIFKSREEFGERYCGGAAGTDNWGREYMGVHRLEELYFLLTKTVLVRRLKDEVGDQLPLKTRQVILLDVASLEKKRNKMAATTEPQPETQQSQEKLPTTTDQKDIIGNTDSRNDMLQWYSDSAKEKVPLVREYLDHLFESDSKSKVIIFAYHHVMLNAIEQCVLKKKIPYIRIDGTTNHSKRQALCDEYQSPNSKIKVAILSIAVAFGLTLSAADLVLFAELYWHPAHLLQAEDRAHRIGRVNPVNVIYILAMDTIDGVLWPILKQKLEIVGTTLDGNAKRVTIDEKSLSTPTWIEDEEDYILAKEFVKEEKNNNA